MLFWEVWSLDSGNVPRRLHFESEAAARAFYGVAGRALYGGALGPAILRSPDGQEEQESGWFDPAGSRLEQLLRFKAAALATDPGAGSWTVGLYMHGGVLLEPFATEEAARTAYRSAAHSKVLFDAEGTPVQCSTQPSDKSGIGVASIIQLRSGELDGPVAEAIRLGKAPFIPPDRSSLTQWATSRAVGAVFGRELVAYCGCLMHPNRSRCYFAVEEFPGVEGYVALTIDDAPCALGRANSMVTEVRELLREHGARATFMLVGAMASGHEEDLADLLRDGHELGNHGMLDRAYSEDSRDDFLRAVDACSDKIRELQRRAGVPEAVHWFRAPHGKFTPTMEEVLDERGLSNVMCDTYACCPVIQDGAFIGECLAREAQHGSIVLIHMPSKGVREWCLDGLRLFLRGLRDRGLQAVTVSELAHRAAMSSRPLRLQWMWAPSGLLTQLPPVSGLVESELLVGRWSELQSPEAVCDELEARADEQSQPVRLRAAGEPRSKTFVSPKQAAQWIRREFVREHEFRIDPGEGSMRVTAELTSARRLIVESVVVGTGCCAGSCRRPEPGDEIVEVNSTRGDAVRLHDEFTRSTVLYFRARRGLAYFAKCAGQPLPSAPAQAESPRPILLGGSGAAAAGRLSGRDVEDVRMCLAAQVRAAEMDVVARTDAAAAVLGTGASFGPSADWKQVVRSVTDEQTVEAFWRNIAGVAWVPAFTSSEKAEDFVKAFEAWCRRAAFRGHTDGRVEAAARAWFWQRGMEVLALDFSPPEADTGPPPLLPEGKRHSPSRRLVGSLGAAATLGVWGGACDWAAGRSELLLGRELSVEFFQELGRSAAEAAARAQLESVDAALDLLRAQVDAPEAEADVI